MKSSSSEVSTPGWAKYLVVLGLLVVFCVGVRTIANPDVWMHLASGRYMAEHGITKHDPFSFTRPDANWINPSWLYDRVLYAIWGAGAGVTTLIHVALILGAFVSLLPLARRWGNGTCIGLALVLSGWLLSPRFDVGPASAGILLAASFIAVLSRERQSWATWAIILPLQLLWTNMHASFLLGPAICAAFTVQAILDVRTEQGSLSDLAPPEKMRILSLLGLCATALVVTLFNPYGIGLHRQVIGSWGNPAYAFIQVWISPFSDRFLPSSAGHIVTLALLIGAGGLVTQKKRLPVALTTIAVLSAFTVVRSVRFVDFFAVLAFPFITLSLSALGTFVQKQAASLIQRPPAFLSVLAGLVTVILAVFTIGATVTNAHYVNEGSAASFGLGVVNDVVPSDAMDVVTREEFPETALNYIHDGGFLAWAAPERKVFVDQRAALYGSGMYQSVFDGILRGEPASWDALVEEWQPDAVIINACGHNAGTAAKNLLVGGHWVLSYFDGTSAIFLRPVSDYAELIGDTEIRGAGLKLLNDEYQDYRNRLGGVIRPPIPARLTGAGSVFMALNRFREAAAIYSVLTRGAPRMAGAWLSLGICQVQINNAEAAVKTLEKSCKMLPKNAFSWLWLSRAYALTGATQDAQFAYEKAENLNPSAAAAFGNPTEKAKE